MRDTTMKKRPALPRDETELPPPPPEDRRREPGRYGRLISAPGDWIRVAPGFRNRLSILHRFTAINNNILKLGPVTHLQIQRLCGRIIAVS